VRVHVDTAKCQGHGRCYALAPELFEANEVGDGREIGDGSVSPEHEAAARKAQSNCPEHAVILTEGA